ncbi:MAG: SH3 domain-containing protein [Lachnospiraceae bacterium]|nr:SH3 domain-containing protein [Lachnospiraceae bacterium]
MVIRMNMLKRKQFLLGCTAAVCMMTMIWCNPMVSLADATGTVTTDSAKIREAADINSNAIGSATKGKEISIKDKVTDASGTVWYHVYVDADTLGYIRSDLVSTEDGDIPSAAPQASDTADTQDSTTDTGNANTGAQGAETQAETVMDAQYATVSVKAAKIRTAPSTNDGVVETLSEGAQLVVSGKSNGGDGKEWYYVTFTGADGTEKTGFVRYDLVSLGDMLPVEEEPLTEPVEEPEQVENISNEFELKYEQEGGEYVWYLYDNRDSQVGNKQKLVPLIEAAEQAMANTTPADTDMVVKQRIVIVVLVVLAVALAIAVIIMAFKLRDAYYEDYEDEEEEDEDDEEDENEPEEEEIRPSKRKGRAGAMEEEEPEIVEKASRRKAVREEIPVKQRAERKPVMREVTYEEEPDVKVPVKTAPKRKAKNFLIDDDDFEFEFLNMDDKDLK